MRTWIYVLVISNKRTAGTLTWQFSPTSVMFYFILPYLPLYINCPAFTYTKGTMKKIKTWSIYLAISGPCQRIWCVVKTDWYIILIGWELTCSRKLMLEIIRIRCVQRAFYRVRTLRCSPLWSQGFGPFAENGFREFHRAKMSYEDTQHKHNKLDFPPNIKLNG